MLPRLSLEKAAKEYMTAVVMETYKGVVEIGPFKGMKMLEEIAWADGNLGTKVLGCYEQELHDFLEEEISRLRMLDRDTPLNILDIGCSEGYYAVGLALRLPEAKVIAVDTSEYALKITQMAAKLNEVMLYTSKDCPYDFKPDLVLCDCEGAEREYMDPEIFPGLKKATLIIECHDSPGDPIITETLGNRFDPTHEIWVVQESARDPNQFEALNRFDSLMRWVAVSEGRPCTMHWLIMKVRKNL